MHSKGVGSGRVLQYRPRNRDGHGGAALYVLFHEAYFKTTKKRNKDGVRRHIRVLVLLNFTTRSFKLAIMTSHYDPKNDQND